MRLSEILLEYNQSITIQKYGDRLLNAAKKDNQKDINIILSALETIDPTKNKQYVEWLIRNYINNKFRIEDGSRITDVLINFNSIKSRLSIEQRDINKFDIHALENIVDNVMNPELNKKDDLTKSNGTFPVIPNSKVLYNGPLGQLAIPETEEASCELGKGTKWCTAANPDSNMLSYYSEDAPLYIWRDKNGEKYQFYFGQELQFMDSNDRNIDLDKLTYFRTKHPVLSKLFKEQEAQLLKDQDIDYLFRYTKSVIKNRWPEIEDMIIPHPELAYDYAKDIIKGRWPEAESSIAESRHYSFEYAKNVIKGRWPEIESNLMSHAKYAYWYADEVINGRWPESEPYIMRNPYIVYEYVKNVIGRRWPEAGKFLETDKHIWYEYQRFLKAHKAHNP